MDIQGCLAAPVPQHGTVLHRAAAPEVQAPTLLGLRGLAPAAGGGAGVGAGAAAGHRFLRHRGVVIVALAPTTEHMTERRIEQHEQSSNRHLAAPLIAGRRRESNSTSCKSKCKTFSIILYYAKMAIET